MQASVRSPEEIIKEAAEALLKFNASKGGRSKSPKKLAAMRRNIKKAWAARRKKSVAA